MRQKKLLEFVKKKHGDQKRKYTNEPYWHHLVSVGELASEYDLELGYEIGLCHDLFEDTDCTPKELHMALIEMDYPYSSTMEIVRRALELTDEFTKEKYPGKNRGVRKKLEAQRLSNISPQAQTVKYADLIDNTSSIVDKDPSFAEVYLREKDEILRGMTHGNHELYQKCLEVLRGAQLKLKE